MKLSPSYEMTSAWWVEINTTAPRDSYSFGPFKSRQAAKLARIEHIQDLYQKVTGDITAIVKESQPDRHPSYWV